jgi:hypothetical protein
LAWFSKFQKLTDYSLTFLIWKVGGWRRENLKYSSLHLTARRGGKHQIIPSGSKGAQGFGEGEGIGLDYRKERRLLHATIFMIGMALDEFTLHPCYSWSSNLLISFLLLILINRSETTFLR